MRAVAVIVIGLSLALVAASAPEPLRVGMIQLLATPEKFDGKLIQVSGFLRLEFEGNALYLHEEDYRHHLFKNGVWVDLAQSDSVNMHYVLIEGVFTATHHGHLGLFGGSIEKITRVEAQE
jgi:hypothetical protein